MFIGHYSAALAIKSAEKSISLGWLFLAAQLVDVFWATFVLLGIERVRIVPGITAANPLDLYFMPYTHSLIAAIGWSAAAFLVARIWCAKRVALLIAVCVFSHWVLDLLVHRPDLPLYGDQYKVGLGLWNYRWLSLALELALSAACFYAYVRATRATIRTTAVVALAGLMIVGGVVNAFGPLPPSDQAVAFSGLTIYLVFAVVAAWADRRRI